MKPNPRIRRNGNGGLRDSAFRDHKVAMSEFDVQICIAYHLCPVRSLRAFNYADLSMTVASKPAAHEERTKVRRWPSGIESMRQTRR
jgi:hypothetical protein